MATVGVAKGCAGRADVKDAGTAILAIEAATRGRERDVGAMEAPDLGGTMATFVAEDRTGRFDVEDFAIAVTLDAAGEIGVSGTSAFTLAVGLRVTAGTIGECAGRADSEKSGSTVLVVVAATGATNRGDERDAGTIGAPGLRGATATVVAEIRDERSGTEDFAVAVTLDAAGEFAVSETSAFTLVVAVLLMAAEVTEKCGRSAVVGATGLATFAIGATFGATGCGVDSDAGAIVATGLEGTIAAVIAEDRAGTSDTGIFAIAVTPAGAGKSDVDGAAGVSTRETGIACASATRIVAVGGVPAEANCDKSGADIPCRALE
jgi:hypothetical protein